MIKVTRSQHICNNGVLSLPASNKNDRGPLQGRIDNVQNNNQSRNNFVKRVDQQVNVDKYFNSLTKDNFPASGISNKIDMPFEKAKVLLGAIKEFVTSPEDKKLYNQIVKTASKSGVTEKQMYKLAPEFDYLVTKYGKAAFTNVIEQFKEACRDAWKNKHPDYQGTVDDSVIFIKSALACSNLLEHHQASLTGETDKSKPNAMIYNSIMNYVGFVESACKAYANCLQHHDGEINTAAAEKSRPLLSAEKNDAKPEGTIKIPVSPGGVSQQIPVPQNGVVNINIAGSTNNNTNTNNCHHDGENSARVGDSKNVRNSPASYISETLEAPGISSPRKFDIILNDLVTKYDHGDKVDYSDDIPTILNSSLLSEDQKTVLIGGIRMLPYAKAGGGKDFISNILSITNSDYKLKAAAGNVNASSVIAPEQAQPGSYSLRQYIAMSRVVNNHTIQNSAMQNRMHVSGSQTEQQAAIDVIPDNAIVAENRPSPQPALTMVPYNMSGVTNPGEPVKGNFPEEISVVPEPESKPATTTSSDTVDASEHGLSQPEKSVPAQAQSAVADVMVNAVVEEKSLVSKSLTEPTIGISEEKTAAVRPSLSRQDSIYSTARTIDPLNRRHSNSRNFVPRVASDEMRQIEQDELSRITQSILGKRAGSVETAPVTKIDAVPAASMNTTETRQSKADAAKVENTELKTVEAGKKAPSKWSIVTPYQRVYTTVRTVNQFRNSLVPKNTNTEPSSVARSEQKTDVLQSVSTGEMK
ncbi:hypothetical protein GQQ22_08725 [Pantoea agglomerans]|uniref:hypothetical protein n=1 Tax=Enterobacter agglomerans TaxID=549 RepID=UPI0013BE8519|nr:hypothetical protein [Pantoea agglomerans]NEG98814.1 hypothetical protein [Pantoea agglomerans]